MKRLLILISLLFPITGFAASLTYTYDRLGRLTNVAYNTGIQINYTYDPMGNRLRKLVVIPANLDSDSDGVPDLQDACPFDPNDPIGDPCRHDEDADGVLDTNDNCPNSANPAQDNFDGDATGDACDDDVDGDGVANNVDACTNSGLGQPVSIHGCGEGQSLCQALADVRGHRFEAEICVLVDAGYWPVPLGARVLRPDEPLPLQEEIEVPINIAGFGELARAEVNGICPGNPYFNFAINRRILKPSMPGCPSPLSEQGLYRPILEAARSLIQVSKNHSNYFWMVASQYGGPDIGNLTTPHWIARDNYKYAYEMGALPDFDENRDPNDVMYGVQTVTRAQGAYIYYHMFYLDGFPERTEFPEASVLEDDVLATLGFDPEFETDFPMQRGDFLGLALRLMKREGCVDYPDDVANPFTNVPGDHEYLAELKKAVEMRLIKQGEGVSTTDPAGWILNYNTYMTRQVESIFLYRLLSKVGACRTSCATLYNRERNNIRISAEDILGTNYPSYAVCMLALEGLPLAEVEADGSIHTHFEQVPEAEESLITLYNVLQINLP
ncbi:MAG: hypothetical protein A2048_00125 [Deltaproteobacteria bacterium GWA2_45_12]|nr:MAG: hypothetical protein A2048_00125 [Deltaproteobacteria bacterium GWA2_45_12]